MGHIYDAVYAHRAVVAGQVCGRRFSRDRRRGSRQSFPGRRAAAARPFDPTPLQEASCLAFGALDSARDATTGAVRFTGTRAGFPLTHPLGHDARTSPETAARGFLSICGSLFGLSEDQSELALERTTTTDDQRTVVRFQQMYRGMPIVGGEIIVHLDRNRSVMATIGKISPQVRVGTAPAITAPDAERAAIQAVAREHGVAA